MKGIVKWLVIIILIVFGRVLVKVVFEISSAKLNDKTYNAVDWSEKAYGPDRMKINLPFSLQEDLKLREMIVNEINSQTKTKQKPISESHIYTYIDEKSAMSVMYSRYSPKISFSLEGTINSGYARLSQQLKGQIISNQSDNNTITYSAKQRNILGYEALEAYGNVKYKGFQDKVYTIRILVIKLGRSIYQVQYMYPSLSGYTEAADSIFNSVKF